MRLALRALPAAALIITSVAGGGTLGAAPAAAQQQTWNFVQADVPAAQSPGHYGRGVLVAVVDTWVDFNQPQFGGRVVDEADCVTGTCRDRTYAPDSCVHGTHVAGTIASAGYGVAPEADILSVQVLSGPAGSPDPNASCSGSAAAVAAGIDFAVAKGARVINLSLGDQVPGLFQSQAITDAVSSAAAHGAVVVFAAGNDGVPLTDSYGNNALLVAATGPSGQLASYTDYNSPVTGDVNVAAPGGDSGNNACAYTDCVLSTFPGNSLGLLEGTSMAAPHVSGLAALLIARDPGLSASAVLSAIERTATPLAGAGSGLIDAARAVSSVPDHPAAVGSPAPARASTTVASPAAATHPAVTRSVPAASAGPGRPDVERGGSAPVGPVAPRHVPATSSPMHSPLQAGTPAIRPPTIQGRDGVPRSASFVGRNARWIGLWGLLVAVDAVLILRHRGRRRRLVGPRVGRLETPGN